MLISPVSTFFLFSLSSSASYVDLTLEDSARLLRFRRFPCGQPQRHSEPSEETHKLFLHTAGRIERPAARGKAGEGGSGVLEQQLRMRRREKQIDFEALKSTG